MNFGKLSLLIILFLSVGLGTLSAQTEAENAIMQAHELFTKPSMTDEALGAYRLALDVSTLDQDKIEIGHGFQACGVRYYREAQKLEMEEETELAEMKYKMAFDAFREGEPILEAEKANPLLQYYMAVSAININKHEEAIDYLEALKKVDDKPSVYHLLFVAYQKVEGKKAKQILNEGIQKYPEDATLIKDAQTLLGFIDTGK